MSDVFQSGWIEIRRYGDPAEAQEHELALTAIGIRCRLVGRETGIGMFVPYEDALQARRELVEYAREAWRIPPQPLRSASEGITASLVYCAVLVFLYSASRREAFGLDWWSAGAAAAGPIMKGEWWRTLTALGLHADFGHLAGNVIAGALFAALLSQLLGAGLAWFAIVLAAGLGNFVDAFVQPAEHTAIGASTAVFAALGLLSALMWRRQSTLWPHGLRRWLPLAAGVTLLAYLGIGGEHTDVGAHAAGFAVGVIFGAGLDAFGQRLPRGVTAQYAFGAAAFVLFASAWLIAFTAVS